MTTTTQHQCARAGQCSAAQVDEAGRRCGAAITTPTGLCPACARLIQRAIGALPRDYVDLEGVLDLRARRGEHVSGSPELPVPPRLDVLVAQNAIDTELATWAPHVAHELGISWTAMHRWRAGPRVTRAAHLLTCHTTLLVTTGPTRVVGWTHGRIHTTRTGLDAALALLQLHQRARLLATGGSGDVRLPVPCPTCEGVLIRPNGLGHVDCRGCGRSWPEADYHRLCLVLAEDYRGWAA